MDTLFLLRSYGDFVVALAGLKRSIVLRPLKLVASTHLQPLYEALDLAGSFTVQPSIEFVDLGIRNHILSCFTNRHFFSLGTVQELLRLKSYINRLPDTDQLFLEQSERSRGISIVTGKSFKWVHDGKRNIYDAYHDFLDQTVDAEIGKKVVVEGNQHVLIFPGSRKKEKQLAFHWVEQLILDLKGKGITVQVAGLPTEVQAYGKDAIQYRSFTTLCELIKEADHIISADSLPAHLAAFFQRSHEIYYRGRLNTAWVTPSGVGKLL